MANDNSINYYVYDSNSGIISADTSQVILQVQAEWQDVFGNNLSVDESTPQGRIIELQAGERKLCLTLNCMTANQVNPNYATGQYLDALASLSGVQRRGATSTIVMANVTGIGGTVIPSGFVCATTAGDQFETRAEYTIDNSGSISNVQFFSVEKGAIPVSAETLTQIITNVTGVETVSNPSAPETVGTEQESDNNLRQRLNDSHYTGTALDGSIKSRINAIPGVVSYWFYDNRLGQAVWVKIDGSVVTTDPSEATAVMVDAHSIILMVEGGEDEAIAKALFSARSCGCGRTAASSPATVKTISFTESVGAFSMTRNEIFNRPGAVNIYASITVKKNTYTGTDADLIADVKNAIASWTAGDIEGVDKPQIGSTISTYEIGAAVSKAIPEIMIADVQIGTASDSLSNAAIPTSKAQIAKFPDANITVTIQ